MVNQNINKNLYKIFLGITKYVPTVMAICFMLNTILAYYKIICPLFPYLGGTSFIVLVLLYIISWVFKFCHLYRIPLHYITIGNIIGIIDNIWTLPISNLGMCRLYFIFTGIMLLIYIWYMYKNRNNPKIDPIKQLCENYCDCNCD